MKCIFPTSTVRYPSARAACANVGTEAGSSPALSTAPVRVGGSPVSSEARDAQRRRAERALEHDALVAETREAWSADDGVPVGRNGSRRELVRNDKQDVRPIRHAHAGAYAA
jgi:hypothetical protein